MLKVLATDNLAPVGLEILERADGIDLDVRPTMDPDTLKSEIGAYQAVIIRSATKLTADVLDAAERLEIAVRAGIGVDNIDVPHATERGILVANTPHGNATTTAEHTFSLIVSLARHVPAACASLKAGRWDKKKYTGTELRGKTLGIIGLGNIGAVVARIARGYEMNVVAYDPFLTADNAKRHGVHAVELNELLERSDVVSLHCPKNDKTKGLIGRDELSRMKPTAFFINCARGGIVDERALAGACKEGVIKGAAVDVFDGEPPAEDNPLLGLDNVVLTPHLGASTKEAQLNVAVEASELILEYATTGSASSAINSQVRLANVSDLTRATVHLARKIGSLQGQLREGDPVRFAVEIFGDENHGHRELILLSAAQTFLEHIFTMDRINAVNVTQFAAKCGTELVGSIVSTPRADMATYTNWVRATVTSKDAGGQERSHSVAGTIFGTSTPKITEIDGYTLDLEPEGTLLVTLHDDRPGVIGKIGTLFGQHDINISRMSVTMRKDRQHALGIIGVDAQVPDAPLDEIATWDVVDRVRQVVL